MKRPTRKISRIGLIANTEKPLGGALVRQAAALLRKQGVQLAADAATVEFARLELPPACTVRALARSVDLLLVFGGDGTMLRVARDIVGSRTPILGVKVGGLGFLTAVSSTRLRQALEQVRRGEFTLETRPLIEARGVGAPQQALNDFVVSRGSATRLIDLEVRVDDEILTHYRCDGLIVCSATGSTAYSLAAGGAVVCPAAQVLTLTPICPHTLSNRSVIVDIKSKVKVRVLSRTVETLLSADGQVQKPLEFGDEVVISQSRFSVRLVRLEGTSFFATLRQKLSWRGTNV